MELSAYAAMRETEDEHWWFVGRRTVLRAAGITAACGG